MEPADYKILLVDDEPDIIEFVSYNLKKEGYNIYTARNGKDAIKMATKINPHLILLDIMMPEIDGITTCEEIRKIPQLSNTLIAILTARTEDYSQIAGFEAGADDYISKPIRPKVLVSRVRAILKRYNSGVTVVKDKETNVINIASLSIDKEKYHVVSDGEKHILPKKEFELLLLLVSKPEKVFTREEIFSKIWGDAIIVGDRTIDVHIRKLRKKFGKKNFQTIKGVGYKFTEEE